MDNLCHIVSSTHVCGAFNNVNGKIVNIIRNGNGITNDLMGKIMCVVCMNGKVFPGLTVWDVHKNGNLFLGLTVCDIHTNRIFFWDSPCGMYIPTKMIFSDYRVGCTYLWK